MKSSLTSSFVHVTSLTAQDHLDPNKGVFQRFAREIGDEMRQALLHSCVQHLNDLTAA